MQEAITFEEFLKLIEQMKDSACGPDGLTYAAWTHAPMLFKETLYRLYLSFLYDEGEPELALNEGYMVLIPKNVGGERS